MGGGIFSDSSLLRDDAKEPLSPVFLQKVRLLGLIGKLPVRAMWAASLLETGARER